VGNDKKHGNPGADDRKAKKLQEEIEAREKALKKIQDEQAQRDN